MKPFLLLLVSLVFTFSTLAQPQAKDSIAAEIKSLEKSRTGVSVKIEALKVQLEQMLRMQDESRMKLQQFSTSLDNSKTEHAKLRQKKSLSPAEKQKLATFRKVESQKRETEKYVAQLEEGINEKLVLLDEAVGLQNGYTQKIKQLKKQRWASR